MTELPQLEDLFPYKYRGGGYFRPTKVPVNESAKILHGAVAIEQLYENIKYFLETGSIPPHQLYEE